MVLSVFPSSSNASTGSHIETPSITWIPLGGVERQFSAVSICKLLEHPNSDSGSTAVRVGQKTKMPIICSIAVVVLTMPVNIYLTKNYQTDSMGDNWP